MLKLVSEKTKEEARTYITAKHKQYHTHLHVRKKTCGMPRPLLGVVTKTIELPVKEV